MTIKISKTALTVNGVRASIRFAAGPWIEGVHPETIKIRSKAGRFPAEFRSAFAVENNSDGMVDYFEADCIRLLPGHPLYAAAKSFAA